MISALPYKYLAGIGYDPATLMSSCVREVEVTAITDIAGNTVSVELDSVTYEDVPIWIHTDYGTRSRKLNLIEASADETQPISETNPIVPELYFERASALFTFKDNARHRSAEQYYAPTYAWTAFARTPRASALVGTVDGVVTVYGIIGVIDNGVLPLTSAQDRRVYAPPTFRPYMLLREKSDAVYTFSLFDMLTGLVAEIPNPAYDALVTAEGLSSSLYDEFFAGGIEEYPVTNYNISYCHVIESGEAPSAVGDTTNAGACTCGGIHSDAWECTAYLDVPDPFGYTEYTWKDTCNTGSSVYVKDDTGDIVNMPTAAAWHVNFTYYGGRNTITWTNRARTDYRDAAYYRNNSFTGGTAVYSYTLIINDEELEVTGTYIGPTFAEFIYESTGSFFFSFSIIYVIIDPPNTASFGDLQNDFTPSTGIITDGITDFIADRYTTLKTANPTGTVGVDPAVVFIPYDIREKALEV